MSRASRASSIRALATPSAARSSSERGGRTMKLWTNCRIATMQANAAQAYGLIADAALAVDGERIHWIGAAGDLPPSVRERCDELHDAHGALITPGLIDCHTHLVYGGDRAHEFELRLNGVSYEEIAR